MPPDHSETASPRENRFNWSQQSLNELEETYWDEIAPVMRRTGLSPSEERPSYEWLAEHGFSGLAYALREHHDLTVTEFFEDIVGLSGSEESNPWGGVPEQTAQALESYLETLARRQGLAESTVTSRRSRLAKYVRTYRDLHGGAPLVKRAGDPEENTAEYERVLATLDAIKADLASDDAAYKYFQTIRDWYGLLMQRNKAVHDPARAVDEFSLDSTEPDNLALDARQVRAIYEVARERDDDLESKLLVLATCGWGLRRNEVARISAKHFELGNDDPRIEFDERKNGPSTVALLFGRQLLEGRIDLLAEQDDWNGYLFPSKRSETGHISANTVTNRFRGLAEEAGVRIRGEPPTPQYGRRFWYDTYKDVVSDMVEMASEIAGDQGSTDPMTVYRNYWSEAERRELRRDAMHDRLAEAFGTSTATDQRSE